MRRKGDAAIFHLDAGRMLRTRGSSLERRRINEAMLSILDSLGLDLLNPTPEDLAEIENLSSKPDGIAIPSSFPIVKQIVDHGVVLDVWALGAVTRATLASWSRTPPILARGQDRRGFLTIGLAAIEGVDPESLLARVPAVDVLIVSDRRTGRRPARKVGMRIVAFAPAEGQFLGRIVRTPDGWIEEEWVSLFDPDLTDAQVKRHVEDLNRAVRSIQEAEARSRRAGPKDRRWAGADGCASCHVEEQQQWLQSGHGRAMATLARVAKDFEGDCLRCHVTAWGDGYVDPLSTPELGDVQCEACHGPGAAHAANPAVAPQAVAADACRTCHTSENSPAFDPERYRERIRHWRRPE